MYPLFTLESPPAPFWILDLDFAIFAKVLALHKQNAGHADPGRRVYVYTF